MTINPQEYNEDDFTPTQAELDASLERAPAPVVRFRKNPRTGELQSNTMIYRWSDGSVTLAVGEDHFDMQTKPLVPPADKPYQELQDSHYYAAAAHLRSNLLAIAGHVGEQYTVKASRAVQDIALKQLEEKLAASRHTAEAAESEMIIRSTQDPEMQKRQADLAEKERERARRRRENAAARVEGPTKSGYGGGRGGLSIGDLEGGSGSGNGGRRGAAGGNRKRGAGGGAKQKRRRPEYDSDDDLPQGARRQDDYDLGDDFIAPSDDEVSVAEDDDEEDLLDDDEEEEERARPRAKRQRTAEPDDDADGDEDDAPGGGGAAAESSRRRRHIIDDDDDDE